VFLVGGELRQWEGEMAEARSPIHTTDNEGVVKQKVPLISILHHHHHPLYFIFQLLGGFPMLGEPEAIDALEAAKKAYDGGLSEWAKMGTSVSCCANDIFKGSPLGKTPHAH